MGDWDYGHGKWSSSIVSNEGQRATYTNTSSENRGFLVDKEKAAFILERINSWLVGSLADAA